MINCDDKHATCFLAVNGFFTRKKQLGARESPGLLRTNITKKRSIFDGEMYSTICVE